MVISVRRTRAAVTFHLKDERGAVTDTPAFCSARPSVRGGGGGGGEDIDIQICPVLSSHNRCHGWPSRLDRHSR